MPKRRISDADGLAALKQWKESSANAPAPRHAILTAVRWTLEELATTHPGRAVEVRVPPAGVVQAFTGTTHRRGTPPSVVETDPDTWLRLATGTMTWDQAVAANRVDASGVRTDLAAYLPLHL